MFRLLSQTLTVRRPLTSVKATRFRSTFSGEDLVVEVDLSPSSSSSPESEIESEALMIKKLDDAVQRMIVQKATPYWLPFLPGSSFWVPPRRGGSGRLKFPDEEPLSLSPSDFVWLSSRYYFDQLSTCEEAEEPAEIETQMEEEALSDSVDTHLSEDKEG